MICLTSGITLNKPEMDPSDFTANDAAYYLWRNSIDKQGVNVEAITINPSDSAIISLLFQNILILQPPIFY